MHKLELNITINLFSTRLKLKRSCLLETRLVTCYIPTPYFSLVSPIYSLHCCFMRCFMNMFIIK